MRKKSKWNRMFNRILSGLLVLLGFSACSDFQDDDDVVICMYGTPTARHEIKGKVVTADKDKVSIPNIQVVVISKFRLDQARKYGVDISSINRGTDTLYTDAQGEFKYEGGGHSPQEEYRIFYNDIDGKENKGLFASDSTDVKTEPTKPGDGSWYMGKGAAEVTAELKASSEEPVEDK